MGSRLRGNYAEGHMGSRLRGNDGEGHRGSRLRGNDGGGPQGVPACAGMTGDGGTYQKGLRVGGGPYAVRVAGRIQSGGLFRCAASRRRTRSPAQKDPTPARVMTASAIRMAVLLPLPTAALESPLSAAGAAAPPVCTSADIKKVLNVTIRSPGSRSVYEPPITGADGGRRCGRRDGHDSAFRNPVRPADVHVKTSLVTGARAPARESRK